MYNEYFITRVGHIDIDNISIKRIVSDSTYMSIRWSSVDIPAKNPY